MKHTIILNNEKFVLYLPQEKIQSRVRQLARRISKDYKNRVPIFIGVLNGSFIFMSDLIRDITVDCEVDFLKLSSYGDAKISSGNVTMLKELNCEVTGRDIVIVEDIVDSGLSIDFIQKLILQKKPQSLRIVTLLYKKTAVKIDVRVDYVGFTIPTYFVIGYGLDYSQKVRNLRGIYRLVDSSSVS